MQVCMYNCLAKCSEKSITTLNINAYSQLFNFFLRKISLSNLALLAFFVEKIQINQISDRKAECRLHHFK